MKRCYRCKEEKELTEFNKDKRGECWHIDHIKPLASFDLTDRRQFMEACNYTNMQPMWCEENNAKSDWS